MRARDWALRRLAAEHVATYRQLKAQRLAAVPATLSRQRARGRAVSQALSELGKQYPERYRALYEQELQRARSDPRPIRRGRPPGPRTDSPWRRHRWRRPGAGRAREEAGRIDRPKAPAAGPSARRSGCARPYCSSGATRPPRSRPSSAWLGRPLSAGKPAGVKGAPQRCGAVGPAGGRRFPIANCRRSSRPCSRALAPTASTVMCGSWPGPRWSSSGSPAYSSALTRCSGCCMTGWAGASNR